MKISFVDQSGASERIGDKNIIFNFPSDSTTADDYEIGLTSSAAHTARDKNARASLIGKKSTTPNYKKSHEKRLELNATVDEAAEKDGMLTFVRASASLMIIKYLQRHIYGLFWFYYSSSSVGRHAAP